MKKGKWYNLRKRHVLLCSRMKKKGRWRIFYGWISCEGYDGAFKKAMDNKQFVNILANSKFKLYLPS